MVQLLQRVEEKQCYVYLCADHHYWYSQVVCKCVVS